MCWRAPLHYYRPRSTFARRTQHSQTSSCPSRPASKGGAATSARRPSPRPPRKRLMDPTGCACALLRTSVERSRRRASWRRLEGRGGFAPLGGSFKPRGPFEANEEAKPRRGRRRTDLLADGVKPRRRGANGCLSVPFSPRRSPLACWPWRGPSSIMRFFDKMPLAEPVQPASAVVASSVNAQTGVCCGLFLQAVASSG